MPTAPKTSRSSGRRWRRRGGSTGAISSPTGPASISSRSCCCRIGWCGSNARTACRASSCAGSTAAKNMSSTSRRRLIRSPSTAVTSSTTDLLRFTYSSMTTPAEVSDYDWRAARAGLRKRQEIPSGHDPADYVTRRLMAPTADGETVPISLLHRKELMLRRHHAAAAVRLRRLRHLDPGRRSPPTGCRWSIAASSTPSPMCAAAAKKAGAGIARQARRQDRTPSATSSPRREYLIAQRSTRRLAASSPMAAPPAAC